MNESIEEQFQKIKSAVERGNAQRQKERAENYVKSAEERIQKALIIEAAKKLNNSDEQSISDAVKLIDCYLKLKK